MIESVFANKGENFGPNFMEFIFDFSQHSIISAKKEYNKIYATFSKTHTLSTEENCGAHFRGDPRCPISTFF